MKIFILSFLCVLGSHLSAQVNDCSKFRTGYFENIDPGGRNTYIKRTKTAQIEWEKMLGGKVWLKIAWLDSCTYTLKLLHGNAQWKKEMQHKFDKFILVVHITSTGPDYYWLSARMDGADMREYTSKIMKIKKW